jgi:hypothetical protein
LSSPIIPNYKSRGDRPQPPLPTSSPTLAQKQGERSLPTIPTIPIVGTSGEATPTTDTTTGYYTAQQRHRKSEQLRADLQQALQVQLQEYQQLRQIRLQAENEEQTPERNKTRSKRMAGFFDSESGEK